MIRAYINATTKAYVRAVLPWFATMVMKWIRDLFARVTTDTGTTGDTSAGAKIYRFLENDGLYDDTKILICPEVAVKTRGTVPLYVTKSYDLSPNNNDAVQTTDTNQPFLAGNIAPNERLGSKRIKTTTTGLTHNNISFTTAEPWSFTVALKSNGSHGSSIYEYVNGDGLIGVRRDGTLYLRNDSSVASGGYIAAYMYQRGKINFLTVIGLGTTIKVYFNGSYINEVTLNSNFSFGRDATELFRGTNYYRRVQSGAMTLAQVQAEHAMLRSIYPEIESVQIGTQTWATSNLEMAATPMGNPINEMQLNTAAEKITNGGFDDANNWTIVGTASISDGVANIDGASNTACWVSQAISIPAGWVKVSFDYTAGTSGYTFISFTNNGNVASLPYNTATGSYVKYFKLTSAESFIAIQKDYSSNNVGIKFDNISVKQLGWADSTELYDGLIAQGYTAANALKEVAWWCYYNNDPAVGATYGKLYNWYAVKLLQTDIDTYNTANPTTPWGWKVPTNPEWETLRTTVASLGWNYDGSTDLGSASINKQGKALASDSFWTASAVEGAVGNTDYHDKRNISGFTGLPGGYRLFNGPFDIIGSNGYWWSSTEDSADTALRWALAYNGIRVYLGSLGKGFGFSVRLIKS